MKKFQTTKRSSRTSSAIAVTLLVALGMVPSHVGSAEGETRTKHASNRNDSNALACAEARESALKLAKLDCMTSGGVFDKPEFSKCECNPMGGKPLCSVSVTYQCV